MQGLKDFGGLLGALMTKLKGGGWRAPREGRDGQLKDMVRYVTVGQHRNPQRAKRREQVRLLGIRQFKKLQRQQRRA